MRIRIARYLPKHFTLNRLRKYFETAAGFQLPEFDILLPKHQNVLAVLGTQEGSLLVPASNIVTDAGDAYYASRGAAATPNPLFTTFALGTGVTDPFAKSGAPSTYVNLTGPIAGSILAVDATYPLVSDADADNTGGGVKVVTWRRSYSKTDFNSATPITNGLITIASPVSGSALLTGFAFAASFTKSADDTLKVFVNHQYQGS